MKFSKISLLSLSFAAGSTLTFAAKKDTAVASKTFVVDAGASVVKWEGKKVTGQHNGAIKIKDGNLVLSNSQITGGQVHIDMSLMTVEDITDAETNAKLVGHLKSDDFFDTGKFPLSTFTIKKAEAIKNPKAEGPTHTISGDLNIKGTSQPISFPATVVISDNSVTAKADIVIDRTKWNIRYGSGKFFKGLGDKVINDEFKVDLNLVAKK